MEQFNIGLFDMNAILELQKKNIEAFSEASQQALKNFQSVIQWQTDILTEMVKEATSFMSEAAKSGTVEEKAAHNADLLNKTYEKSVTHGNKLAAMIGKAGKETSDIIHKHVESSLTEMKPSLHKNEGKHSVKKKAA